MKITQTGVTYKVYGEDLVVLDKLPANVYVVRFAEDMGFFLEKRKNLEVNESRVYGVHEEKANKVLDRFAKTNKNLGVILSGDKGIGKSLFARVLSNKANEIGMPVIIVDKCIPGISSFLDRIETEAMVLFDEFDKTFCTSMNRDPQTELLSLFDGLSTEKKLFVITCNRYKGLNEYLINRPGRFHFHFRFEYPTAEDIKEYLTDKLDEKYYEEIQKVISFSRKTKLNYDCLAAIAFEINQGEKFEDAIKDLNIINDGDNSSRFNIKLYTKEGDIFTTSNAIIDLFNPNSKTEIYLDDESGDNDILIEFITKNIVFDDVNNLFIISEGKFKVTPCNYNKKLFDKYSSLHYDHVEIVMADGNAGIHYNIEF